MPSDSPLFFEEDSDEVAADKALRKVLDHALSHPEPSTFGAALRLQRDIKSSHGFVLELAGQPLEDLIQRAKPFLVEDDMSAAWNAIVPFVGRGIRFAQTDRLQALADLAGDSVELDADLAGDSVEIDDGPPPARNVY